MDVEAEVNEQMLSMVRVHVHQKRSIVGTNLIEAIAVVGAIRLDRKWASDVPSCLPQTPNLGVGIINNDHNARWSHASE